jgi:hypothetical protein
MHPTYVKLITTPENRAALAYLAATLSSPEKPFVSKADALRHALRAAVAAVAAKPRNATS